MRDMDGVCDSERSDELFYDYGSGFVFVDSGVWPFLYADVFFQDIKRLLECPRIPAAGHQVGLALQPVESTEYGQLKAEVACFSVLYIRVPFF